MTPLEIDVVVAAVADAVEARMKLASHKTTCGNFAKKIGSGENIDKCCCYVSVSPFYLPDFSTFGVERHLLNEIALYIDIFISGVCIFSSHFLRARKVQ